MPSELLSAPIDWMATRDPVPYATACAFMARRVEAIATGAAGEVVWLLEHPSLYTAGTSAKREHLIEPDRLPVFRSPRGGQFTYHGPGQRVVYLMLDVQARFGDVRAYVAALEQWIIAVLAEFGVAAQCREGLIGVWVRGRIGPPSSPKSPPLACACDAGSARTASASTLRRTLTILLASCPAGSTRPVTSLARLGCQASLAEVDAALRSTFEPRFGPVQNIKP